MKEMQVNIVDSNLVEMLPEIQLKKIEVKFPKRKLTMIHIGGYDGDLDLIYSKTFKKIIIHTIEPCPKNYKYLKNKFDSNPKVIPYHICISDYDMLVPFYLYLRKGNIKNNLSSQSNSLFPSFHSGKDNEESRQINIFSLSLNSFCLKNKIEKIDLLRINCEGGEFKIFSKQANLSFLDKVNIVHIFIHGKALEFLGVKKNQAKIRINQQLKHYGFELLYGYDLTKTIKYPVGHIQQIWIKNNYE